MKKTLTIMLDFGSGVFWPKYESNEIGKHDTGIQVVDNDPEIWIINDAMQQLFDSYYEFDSHDQAFWFNEEKEKADKGRMLALLNRLLKRLDDINDGTFIVDDRETARLEAL